MYSHKKVEHSNEIIHIVKHHVSEGTRLFTDNPAIADKKQLY